MARRRGAETDLRTRVAELEAELEAWRSREWGTDLSVERMNVAPSPLERTLRGLILELRRELYRSGEWDRHGFMWVRNGALHADATILDMTDPTVPEEMKARIRTLSSTPQPLTRGSTAGLAALERRTITIGDIAGPEGDAFPDTKELYARQIELGGSP